MSFLYTFAFSMCAVIASLILAYAGIQLHTTPNAMDAGSYIQWASIVYVCVAIAVFAYPLLKNEA